MIKIMIAELGSNTSNSNFNAHVFNHKPFTTNLLVGPYDASFKNFKGIN